MFGDAWIDFYPQNMAKADAHPFLLRFRDGNVRNCASHSIATRARASVEAMVHVRCKAKARRSASANASNASERDP
jgi:hypothetical protein